MQNRWSVLAVGLFPEAVKADFRAAFDVTFLDATPPGGVAAEATGRDALIMSFGNVLRRDAILALPASIKAIATYSVGYEHIDVAVARQRGLPVLNTPDVLTDAVAEIGLFLMLGAARRATESIALIRGRDWPGWNATQLIGIELVDKKLGILGMGRIGRGIARRAHAFGMEIHYHNRNRVAVALEEGAIFHADFAAMAGEIDVLMVAAHLSAETRHYVNAERIALLKPGAIVCNIARGDLIDDSALIAALQDGPLRAAGLDVFEGEPKIDPRYYDLPNVFMLPHIGSSTIETRRRMGKAVIAGLLALKDGKAPTNRVV